MEAQGGGHAFKNKPGEEPENREDPDKAALDVARMPDVGFDLIE